MNGPLSGSHLLTVLVGRRIGKDMIEQDTHIVSRPTGIFQGEMPEPEPR